MADLGTQRLSGGSRSWGLTGRAPGTAASLSLGRPGFESRECWSVQKALVQGPCSGLVHGTLFVQVPLCLLEPRLERLALPQPPECEASVRSLAPGIPIHFRAPEVLSRNGKVPGSLAARTVGLGLPEFWNRASCHPPPICVYFHPPHPTATTLVSKQ